MTNNIKNFIQETAFNNQRNRSQYNIFGNIDLFIVNPLSKNINILNVIDQVEAIVPKHIASKVDGFYIGDFQEFRERDVNAMYKDGSIYISNHQDDDADMVDDIIHELAHAAENLFSREIYEDGKIQKEFLGKRTRLKNSLKEYGYIKDLSLPFHKVEYNADLDNYLYKQLGYDKLETFCMGLFIRPYAVTSLREYFATAFEEYLLGDTQYVQRISPMAYEKISLVCSGEV